MGRKGWLDASAGCCFSSQLVFAMIIDYCGVGSALQDGRGGLCSYILCVLLIFRRTLETFCVSVPHSAVWMGSLFALPLPWAGCRRLGRFHAEYSILPFTRLRTTLPSYTGAEPRPVGSGGGTCAFHSLWIRQPGHSLLLAAAYDAEHMNFTAAVNGSCAVTSSLQELAHKGLWEMRETERTMYGLCIPAECSFLHHGKWCVHPRTLFPGQIPWVYSSWISLATQCTYLWTPQFI